MVTQTIPEHPNLSVPTRPSGYPARVVRSAFELAVEPIAFGQIDEFVFAKLKEIGIKPAHPCSEAVFLRRSYLDVIGAMPTAQEAALFLEDRSVNKRAALVDALLDRDEFADYWALKWSDILRVKSEFPINLWPIGNANGEPTAQTLATGTPSGALSTAWTYDALGQLTSLVNASPSGVRSAYGGPSGIGYDGAGNVTSVAAKVGDVTSSTSYGLNGAFELTSAGSLTNFYDGAGNPTTLRGQAVGYNADNELTSAQGLYQYDNNGNPTTYAGVALTFNPGNEPTAIGGALTAGYSADGLRAWKANAQGTKTYYIYDGSTPVCEMSGGLPVAENTFGPTGLVSRTGLTAGYGANGVACLSGYSTAYYMFDAAGNVSERDDASGDIMSTGSFDAFGAGGMQTVPGTTGLSGDPFGFGGRFGYYTDSETRLVLCGQRYYDPGTARWLTRDPIGLFGGVNPYAYCGNNPVGAADPRGEWYISGGVGWTVILPINPITGFPAVGAGGGLDINIGKGGISLTGTLYDGAGLGVGAAGGLEGGGGPGSVPTTGWRRIQGVSAIVGRFSGTVTQSPGSSFSGSGSLKGGLGFGVMPVLGFSGPVGVSWGTILSSVIDTVATVGNQIKTGTVTGIYSLYGLNGDTAFVDPCPGG